MHPPNYELPTTTPKDATKQQRNGPGWFKSLHSRRHARACFGLALFSLGCIIFTFDAQLNWRQSIFPLQTEPPTTTDSMGKSGNDVNLPPLYEEWYEYERRLPQHNVSLPFPEGANGLYFYPANHVWGESLVCITESMLAYHSKGLGFNNVVQEVLFLAHLSYISNRSYVIYLSMLNICLKFLSALSLTLIPGKRTAQNHTLITMENAYLHEYP